MTAELTTSWKVESIRFSIFTSFHALEHAKSLWSRIVDSPAEQVTENLRQSLFNQEGDFGGGNLALTYLPLRIDLMWHIKIADDIIPDGIQDIGALGDCLPTFLELVKKWIELDDFPSVHRLALALVLVDPVDSRASGYKKLATLLPAVDMDPEGSSDFSFQINRPRSSSVVPGLVINRLTKWSVLAKRSARLRMDNSGPKFHPGTESLAVRLEQDVNTAAEHLEPFDKASILPLVGELKSIAEEIARAGDIK